MNRTEFMAQLERLLYDIPASERQDAIAYYNDYFDEAGPENEASVIQELGNPGKVAGIIKADLRSHGEEPEEEQYTENGYQSASQQNNRQMPQRRQGYQIPKQKGRGMIAVVIILILATSPVWIGAVGGLLGGLMGLAGIFIGIIAGSGFGGLGLGIGGIACVFAGIAACFSSPGIGVCLMGAGFLMAAIGMLLILFFVWFTFKAVPCMFRGFVDLCQKLLHKGKSWIQAERTNDGSKEGEDNK